MSSCLGGPMHVLNVGKSEIRLTVIQCTYELLLLEILIAMHWLKQGWNVIVDVVAVVVQIAWYVLIIVRSNSLHIISVALGLTWFDQ